MGNIFDSLPDDYDISKVHGSGVDSYMAVYKHNRQFKPFTEAEKRKRGEESARNFMGQGASNTSPLLTYNMWHRPDQLELSPDESTQIGTKILEDVFERPGEYYVMSKGKKLYLTQGGVYRNDVSDILKMSDNYQAGPTIAILGTPDHPRYLAWASTDTITGDEWTPVEIKSIQDFQHYLRLGHGGVSNAGGKMIGHYGSMAVDPFAKKPGDAWTTASKIGEVTNAIGRAMALPIINAVVDDFTAGIGSLVMQVTGINDAIESGFEQLDNLQLTKEYVSDVQDTDPLMYDQISDPRLDQWFDTVKNTVKTNATQYWKHDSAKELGHVLRDFHESSPQWKIKKLKKLEEGNANLAGDVQIDELIQTVATLQKVVPGYDWKRIQDDIKTANSASDKIEMVTKYSDEIAQNVMPIMQAQMQKTAQLRQQQAQQQAQMRQQAEMTPEQRKEQYNLRMRASAVTHPTFEADHQESAVTHSTLPPTHHEPATINGKYEGTGPMSHFHG